MKRLHAPTIIIALVLPLAGCADSSDRGKPTGPKHKAGPVPKSRVGRILEVAQFIVTSLEVAEAATDGSGDQTHDQKRSH